MCLQPVTWKPELLPHDISKADAFEFVCRHNSRVTALLCTVWNLQMVGRVKILLNHVVYGCLNSNIGVMAMHHSWAS